MRGLFLLGAALALGPAAANAATSGNTAQGTGASQAVVVAPTAISNTGALRFGQFLQPSVAGTLTITPTGTLSATGGVTANQLTQTGGGTSPGTFQVVANTGQTFMIFAPANFAISGPGGASMNVTNITGTLNQTSSSGGKAYYALNIGATLNVNANQAVGTYTGTYALMAYYL